jgi:hypothetical protein
MLTELVAVVEETKNTYRILTASCLHLQKNMEIYKDMKGQYYEGF